MDGAPRLSILVAFRDTTDGHRTRVWELIRDRLEREFADAEVVVGTDDGADPFHKTLALNRAAAAASGDIFAIWDADTWVPPPQVKLAAAALVTARRQWWRPWNRKHKLLELPTAEILAAGSSWDGEIAGMGLEIRPNGFASAPPVMLAAESFAEVGGFDERFRGWGDEDVAFAVSCRALLGPGDTVEGKAIHLWHPRIGRSGRDLWPGQETFAPNAPLMRAYTRAARKPELMRELIAARNS